MKAFHHSARTAIAVRPCAAGLVALVVLLSACDSGFRSGSEANPIPLPDNEASKVSGKVDPTEKGVLKLDVYNGSAWHVSWVEVEVLREADNVKRQFRAYAMISVYETKTVRHGQVERLQQILKEMRKSPAPPLQNSTFYASIGDFLADVKTKDDYQVSILSVVGLRKK